MNIEDFFALFQKTESEWLDFKEEYHLIPCELLHDILCLANALTDNDRHLVFGITNDGRIVGIENDPNRKTQAQVLDLIKNSNLNVIPTLKISSITYQKSTIDVLTIANRPEKPYYLMKDKSYKDKLHRDKCIRAGVVYGRIGDTNIPLNGCLDDKKLELLYLERFGIDKPPLVRFRRLLCEKMKWKYYHEENDMIFYHTENPEFTIRFLSSGNADFQEPWANDFPDPKAFRELVNLKYFGTTLYTTLAVYCDGARYLTIAPKTRSFREGKDRFFYFTEDSIEYEINEMIYRNYPQYDGQLHDSAMILKFITEDDAELKIKDAYEKQKLKLPFYQFIGPRKGYEKLNV